LELVLQLDRDNVPLLKRVVELLLERNEVERAREYVKMLTRLAPKDPFVERTEKQLMGGL
jgi:DNA-binding SARP family transcriptional activator